MSHPLTELIPPLKPTDRCDRCGAMAYVAVLVNVRQIEPLMFCGHHFMRHRKALAGALAIRDERDRVITDAAAS